MIIEPTDRNLLKLAAVAAGLGVEYFALTGFSICAGSDWGRPWNPLDDDGDAFRLGVHLGITVSSSSLTHQSTAYCPKLGSAFSAENKVPHEGDPYRATRRAMVLAAAKLGEQMLNSEQLRALCTSKQAERLADPRP